jgi:putative transcriptional regulator
MKKTTVTKAQLTKRTEHTRTSVAEQLLDARTKLGLTQLAVAQAARIDRKTVNRIENEHFSPSMETFVRLCAVLEVKAETVLANANKQFKSGK